MNQAVVNLAYRAGPPAVLIEGLYGIVHAECNDTGTAGARSEVLQMDNLLDRLGRGGSFSGEMGIVDQEVVLPNSLGDDSRKPGSDGGCRVFELCNFYTGAFLENGGRQLLLGRKETSQFQLIHSQNP